MILTVNIGNTNITLGGYTEGHSVFHARMHTNAAYTTDEFALRIRQLLELKGFSGSAIDGAILSSVVPSLTGHLTRALSMLTEARVLTVGPGLKSGIRLCLDDPAELGSELLCGIAAALDEYPGPVVMLCADTAMSMIAANAKREIVGGVIVPAPRPALAALVQKAARLPQVELQNLKKHTILGKSTAACLQNGILLGTAAQIDGLADRFRAELGENARFFATGDIPESVRALCRTPLEYRKDLISDGMYSLWRRNCKG